MYLTTWKTGDILRFIGKDVTTKSGKTLKNGELLLVQGWADHDTRKDIPVCLVHRLKENIDPQDQTQIRALLDMATYDFTILPESLERFQKL